MQKINVAIIGGTGYTGQELLRYLSVHPRVNISVVTSRSQAGVRVQDVLGWFSNPSLKFESLKISALARRIKAVFLCLPHHEAMNVAKSFRSKGVVVFDLSADFRLKNPKLYEQWYGPHTQTKLLKSAVYGLPELFGQEIMASKLIACPGCYPTGITLGLAPLVSEPLIALNDIIVDAKSGVSGAGRTAKVGSLFVEVNESMKPYNVGIHRHQPEIEQNLSALAGQNVKILFTPQLAPMDRGILATIYVKPFKKLATENLLKIYRRFYAQKPFVRILNAGQWPDTKDVNRTNFCHIGLHYDSASERIIIATAIDNLGKGASGQAVQVFNLVYKFPETMGLI